MKQLIAAILMFFIITSCNKADSTIGFEDLLPRSNLAEKIIIDTAYGKDPLQKMDIYLPAGRTSQTRLNVMIHGGTWVGGDKSELNNLVQMYRSRWPECAVVNVNYRLANGKDVTYNQILEDVGNAINLMASNKILFAISDTMALWGINGGALLALQYANSPDTKGIVKCVADFYGPAKIDDWDFYNARKPVNVKDILKKFSGSGWNEELYKSISPVENLNTSSKPTIIFHGNLDNIVPAYQSQLLKQKLDELGVANEYHEYTDFHGFTETNNTESVEKTIQFFKKHLK